MKAIHLLVSGMFLINATHLSKISPAEQKAIIEGPKILEELVPAVISSIEHPGHLKSCMQVSRHWYKCARHHLLDAFGRLGIDNEILPDYTKIMKSTCNLAYLRQDCDLLSKELVKSSTEFTRNDSFRSWASRTISMIPYSLEIQNITAFTWHVTELLDIGGYGDVIRKMIPFRDRVNWDPVKLAWHALLKGEGRDLVLVLAEGASEEDTRVLELASAHQKGLIAQEEFLVEVKSLLTVPLHLLVYLCRIGAEDCFLEMSRAKVKLTGNPKDCEILMNLVDCGPINLEIYKYCINFPEFEPVIIALSPYIPLYQTWLTLDATLLPVFAYMAFGTGPLGQTVMLGGDQFQILLTFVSSISSMASEILYSYLKGSYGIPAKSTHLLVNAICAIPTKNMLGYEISFNMKTFTALIEHPVLKREHKKTILGRFFKHFPWDSESLLVYLENNKDFPDIDLGYYHFIFWTWMVGGSNVFEIMKSSWKYIHDRPELVRYIAEDARPNMEYGLEEVEVFETICNEHISSSIFKTLTVHEHSFLQNCIIWAKMTKDQLLNIIERHIETKRSEKALWKFKAVMNCGLEPSSEDVDNLFKNNISLCQTLLLLMNVGGPRKYFDVLAQSVNLTDEVIRNVVRYAIYSNASEKDLIQVINLKENLSEFAQRTICVSLLQVSYPEPTVRKVISCLSRPSIDQSALEIALTNQWYSEDFLSLLKSLLKD